MTVLATDSGRKSPARLAGSAVLACQSDERLARLVREGHERAFDALVARYRRPLVRFCRRVLPESRAEDAVQQALLNAHAALTGGDEPLQLRGWLYAITRNAALNMLRQNGWNYEPLPLDFDGVPRPDQLAEQHMELEATVAALQELPDRQREAIVMREFEGRSYAEIAAALGTGDGAVRQLLNRARGSLRAVATALMPPPIVARVASWLPPSDGRRVTEVVGGVGAAGVAKLGAGALVAGSLVVGAINAPFPALEKHPVTRQKATLAAQQHRRKPSATVVAAAPAAAARTAGTHVANVRHRTAPDRRTAVSAPATPQRTTGERGTQRQTSGGSEDSAGRTGNTHDGSETHQSGDTLNTTLSPSHDSPASETTSSTEDTSSGSDTSGSDGLDPSGTSTDTSTSSSGDSTQSLSGSGSSDSGTSTSSGSTDGTTDTSGSSVDY